MKKTQRRLIPAITTVLLLVSLLVPVFASMASAASGENLGKSPYINQIKDAIDIDESRFYEGTTVFKLPSTVKDTDELSLIVQMKNQESLLDAYDKMDTDMSFSQFYATAEAAAIRNDIRDAANEKLALLREQNIAYNTGVSYTTLISGFEITASAADFKDICQALGDDVTVIAFNDICHFDYLS